ncbi:Pycsar system effector family protein [Nonomuraea sp. NPDC049714]|uniref:Pycsar system effector family protein n=1 Tax=Nonomuraea sp. NPDC049714 TaxID=3364357 RepID=UPI0037ACE3B5
MSQIPAADRVGGRVTAFPGAPAALQREGDAVRAELARIDTKASALMGWAGTAFAILAATASVIRLPLLPLLAVSTGAALLAAAVTVLLWVIRPALPAPGAGYGFVRHAAAKDAGELLAMLGAYANLEQRLAGEALRLSKLAVTKYRRLRTAVDLLLAALVCLVVALPLGVLS